MAASTLGSSGGSCSSSRAEVAGIQRGSASQAAPSGVAPGGTADNRGRQYQS